MNYAIWNGRNGNDNALGTQSSNYLAADGHVKYLRVTSVSWGSYGPAPTGIGPDALGSPNLVLTFNYDASD